MSPSNKGFSNKAKSGARATIDRWRQAAEKAKVARRGGKNQQTAKKKQKK